MKSYYLILASVFMLFSCTETENNRPIVETNQTIYYGGDILTMVSDQPQYVEAVVRDRDKIIFTGSKSEALKQYGNAVPYDLEGKTMLPAFIDPHSHFMSAIRMVKQVNLASPPMGTANSITDIMNLLKEYKTQNDIKDGDWIVGWGYDQDLLDEKRHITKTDIDAFFPNNKVLIVHVSMHGAILNSKALEWAEIDENTQTPDGGVIARMPNSNEPAGLLMEMAYIPVFGKMPQPSVPEMLELVIPAQLMYASNGYAQAVEGFSHISDMDFF